MNHDAPEPRLHATIKKMIALSHHHRALRHGDYEQLHVAHEQFAFMRRESSESIIVALNAAAEAKDLALRVPETSQGRLVDLLNDGESFEVKGGNAKMTVQPRWARILKLS